MLCTGPFRRLVDVSVASAGAADLRVVEVDHPLGGIGEDDLQQRIDAATTLTLDLLGASS